MKEKITPLGKSLFILPPSSCILARLCGYELFGLERPEMRICGR